MEKLHPTMVCRAAVKWYEPETLNADRPVRIVDRQRFGDFPLFRQQLPSMPVEIHPLGLSTRAFHLMVSDCFGQFGTHRAHLTRKPRRDIAPLCNPRICRRSALYLPSKALYERFNVTDSPTTSRVSPQRVYCGRALRYFENFV